MKDEWSVVVWHENTPSNLVPLLRQLVTRRCQLGYWNKQVHSEGCCKEVHKPMIRTYPSQILSFRLKIASKTMIGDVNWRIYLPYFEFNWNNKTEHHMHVLLKWSVYFQTPNVKCKCLISWKHFLHIFKYYHKNFPLKNKKQTQVFAIE